MTIPTSVPSFFKAPFVTANGVLTEWAVRFLQTFVASISPAVTTAQTTANTAQTTATAAGVAAATAQASANPANTAVAAETTRAEAAEALLAPKASPTFTGTVVLPVTSTKFSAALTSASNDSGASSAGVPLYGLYWNTAVSAVVQRRV